MTESLALLHAAAALLLLGLGYLHPRARARARRGDAVLLAGGALIPLLDLATGYLVSADRIELLTGSRFFYGPYGGALVVGSVAVVWGMAWGARTALRPAALMGAGFLLHLGLAWLTPTGVPWAAPFSPRVWAWGIFPAGHLALVAGLTAFVAALLLLRGLRPWIFPAAAGFVVLYVLAGVGQYAYLRVQTRGLAGPGRSVAVEPVDPLMMSWQITVTEGARYELRRFAWLRRGEPTATEVPRWNDLSLLTTMLADPIVRHFYYRVFRHPVVRVEALGSQIALTMQELRDQIPPVPGPRLYVEANLDHRDRYYQLQRVD